MSKHIIIGVMGAGEQAHNADIEVAFILGKLIAQEKWTLLTGGRNAGVMDAANKGAKSAHGLTIGILPTNDTSAISEAVDIPIITDMGSARNNINVLSSHVVIACGNGGAGTASEIALAIKAGKPVVLLKGTKEAEQFFKKIDDAFIYSADTPEETIRIIKTLLLESHGS